MALALHEPVPIRHRGVLGIMVHDSEEEARHDFDAGQRRSEVGAAAPCPKAHLDDMPPHQSSLLVDEVNCFRVCHMCFSVRDLLTCCWLFGILN